MANGKKMTMKGKQGPIGTELHKEQPDIMIKWVWGVELEITKVEPATPVEYQPITVSFKLSPSYSLTDEVHNGYVKAGPGFGNARVRVAATYEAEIIDLTIHNPRSLNNDTIVGSYGAYFGDSQRQFGPKGYGDHGKNGEHIPIGFKFGPFNSVPGQAPDFELDYLILNQGFKGSAEEWLLKILGLLNQAGEKVAEALVPQGKAFWPAVAEVHDSINKSLIGNCDRVLAARQITLSGAMLDQETSRIGAHDDEFLFEGDEAKGCGERSHYSVHVQIRRPSFRGENPN